MTTLEQHIIPLLQHGAGDLDLQQADTCSQSTGPHNSSIRPDASPSEQYAPPCTASASPLCATWADWQVQHHEQQREDSEYVIVHREEVAGVDSDGRSWSLRTPHTLPAQPCVSSVSVEGAPQPSCMAPPCMWWHVTSAPGGSGGASPAPCAEKRW
eukprot:CAMPEP_0202890034 /NCGR_PEP_ID=MMETSP1392-20130828/557_1 /ASSEMBLY_ACC=CAM_ASM_000868 /TAXON_ID=225041 /ORGANISM="Chlamydomonas chlamydogama, Strain SAG 11-48b" /LENGTH=155 /DNA_ID=CAMNT_0049573513 /DNA_START=198 /DNA_END=663 /DNA_ORIENTATION=+